MASEGLVTLPAGIALALGANIGTCVTAGLAAVGTTREAKRVALAHVLFKIAGVDFSIDTEVLKLKVINLNVIIQ